MLFEQSQSVISRIQQILREYPFGNAVLLELLQNADDAGATLSHLNLIVPPPPSSLSANDKAGIASALIEKRFGSNRLTAAVSDNVDHAVDEFQHDDRRSRRPVLEFFNNSVFTERDLKNIQSIGGSTDDSKKHDGTKVGRFGLGFNSAYHIADVILFVSNSALIVLDPSRTILPPNKPGEPRTAGGYRWNYVEESQRLEDILTQHNGTHDSDGVEAVLSEKDLFFLALMELLETSDAQFFSDADNGMKEQIETDESGDDDEEEKSSNDNGDGDGEEEEEDEVDEEEAERSDTISDDGEDDDNKDASRAFSNAGSIASPCAAQQQQRVPFSRFASYPGTLFRFPLRRAPSILWKECHDANTIATMMCGFPQMATLGLVLTKNVNRFDAFVTTPATATTATTKTATAYKRHALYSVKSNGWSDDVQQKKMKCVAWLKAYTTAMERVATLTTKSNASADTLLRECMLQLPMPTQVCLTIALQITRFPTYMSWLCNNKNNTSASGATSSAASTSRLLKTLCSGGSSASSPPHVSHKAFTVSHQFGPGKRVVVKSSSPSSLFGSQASFGSQVNNNKNTNTNITDTWAGSSVWAIAEECARYSHPISVPWGATIIENGRSLTLPRNVDDEKRLTRSSSSSTGGGSSGVLMCFFPIRASTGLPAHIHGYFQLSSDRQSVASVDRNRWNAALCSEVIPFSYASAVQQMCVARPLESPLHLWPLGVYKDDVTIELIASRTIAELASRPVFPTLTRHGDTKQEEAVEYVGLADVKSFAVATPTLLKPQPLSGLGFGGLSFGVAPASVGGVHLSSVTFDTYRTLLLLEVASRPPQKNGFHYQRNNYPGRLLYVESERDFSQHLSRILSAMSARNITIEQVHASYCRAAIADALKHDDRVRSHVLPLSNAILAPLLTITLEDGNYSSFVSMFQRDPNLCAHVLMPLVSGFGSSRTIQRFQDTKPQQETTFLLAANQGVFDIARTIAPFKEKLIFCLQEKKKPRPSISGSQVNPETIQEKVCRHFTAMLDLKGHQQHQLVELLSEKTFLEKLIHVCSSEVGGGGATMSYKFVSKTTSRSGEKSDDGFEWRLCIVLKAPQRGFGSQDVVPPLCEILNIPGGAQHKIFRWFKSLNLRDYAKLPLLPRQQDNLQPQQEHQRRCVSPTKHVCIALDNSIPTTASVGASANTINDDVVASCTSSPQELLGIFHFLTLIGAVPLDTSVVPIEHIYAWNAQSDVIAMGHQQPISPFQKDGPAHCFAQGVVAIITASDVGALNAVSVMRTQKVADWGDLLHQACPTASDDGSTNSSTTSENKWTYADVLRRYFARYQKCLSSADKEFLASLPLLRTVWPAQFIRRGNKISAGFGIVIEPHLFLLPDTIPHEMQALIRSAPLSEARVNEMLRGRQQISSSRAFPPVSQLKILEREATEELTKQVASLFNVSTLTELDASTLSACILGGPILTNDAHSTSSLGENMEGNSRAVLWGQIIGIWSISALPQQQQQQQNQQLPEPSTALRNLLRDIPLFYKHQTVDYRNSSSLQDGHQATSLPVTKDGTLIPSRLSINSSSIPADILTLASLLPPTHKSVDPFCFVDIPDMIQEVPKLLEFLGIATKITGSSLTQFCTLASEYFRSCGVIKDPCSRQAKQWLQLSRALLKYLEDWAATTVFADIKPFTQLKIVPVLAGEDSCLGTNTTEMTFSFEEAACARNYNIFRLCPIGSRYRYIHPAVDGDDDATSSNRQGNFPRLWALWNTMPDIYETLAYIAKMSAVHSSSPSSTAPAIVPPPHRPSVEDWHAVLAYVDAAAAPKATEDVKLLQVIRSSFSKGLFSPTKNVAIPLHELSLGLTSEDCYPIISFVEDDNRQLTSLWKVLQIPLRHSFETLRRQLLHYSSEWRRENNINNVVPLSKQLLNAYINVVKLMVNKFPQESRAFCQQSVHNAAAEEERLWLPVVNGSLKPGHELFYDISTVLSTDSGIPAPDQALTLHPGIGIEIAKCLDLQHVSVQLVSRMQHSARQRNLSNLSFQARGQRQKVTDSIKRVLGDYSDKQSVIVEMLQNADDAGAKNVTFYLDTRSFDTTKPEGLLGREMIRCQGPSLVVFNDQLFSVADFDALYSIGCGHKAGDPTAIGRFGVGFNSVYRLTDCVSIISGDTTQFLDPAAAHLGMATETDPGLMIQHTAEPTLASTFSAQFAPYTFYGVDLTKKFEGTLFRLPLREEVRKDISLCNESYTPSAIRILFQGFDAFLPHILLFLKNVETISFMEVTDDASHRASPPRCELISRVSIHDYVDHHDDIVDERLPSPSLPSTSLPAAGTSRLDATSRVVVREYRKELLASVNGSLSSSSSGSLHRAVVSVSIERNAAAERPKECYSWLLCSVIRSSQDLPTLACDPTLKPKLLPWGAVALQLFTGRSVPNGGDSNECSRGLRSFVLDGSTRLPSHLEPCRTRQSILHCSLPLPSVKGEFPFHVHGSFALTSDRRGMWTHSLSDEQSWEVTWNQYVLGTVVADAAVRALELYPSLASATPLVQSSAISARATVDQNALRSYYELFPTATEGTEGYAIFRTGFYKEIFRSQAKLLWCHMKNSDNGPDISQERDSALGQLGGTFVAALEACCVLSDVPQKTMLLPSQAAPLPSHQVGPFGFAAPQQQPNYVCSLDDDIAAYCIPLGQSLCRVPGRVVEELRQAKAHQITTTTASTSQHVDTLVLSPEVIAWELLRRAGVSQTFSVVLSTIFRPEEVNISPSNNSAEPTDNNGTLLTEAAVTTASDRAARSVAQLAMYVCQVEDKSMLRGLPLVLLEDGTVGIVGKAIVNVPDDDYLDEFTHDILAPKGQARTLTDDKCMFLDATSSNGGGEAARILFPLIPAVDKRYLSAIRSVLIPETCKKLLCIEPLDMSNIGCFMQWFADPDLTAARGMTFEAPYDATLTFDSNPQRIFCTNFWTFVSQSQEYRRALERLISPASTQTPGSQFHQQQVPVSHDRSILSWPLIPAQFGDVAVLVPISEVSALAACSSSLLDTVVAKGNQKTDLDDVLMIFSLLGVRIVDQTFPLSNIIQSVCNIPELVDKDITTVLQTALDTDRFSALEDTERDTLLEWLVETFVSGANRYRFFTTRFGHVSIGSIAQLPLFPVLSRIDNPHHSSSCPQLIYEYQSLPPQTEPTKKNKNPAPIECHAMIPGMPPCFGIGLHKRAIKELHVVEINPIAFLMTRVLPHLESRNGPQPQSSELITVLNLLAKHVDVEVPQKHHHSGHHYFGSAAAAEPSSSSRTVGECFENIKLLPSQRSYEDVKVIRKRERHNNAEQTNNTNNNLSLKKFASEWFADAHYLPHSSSALVHNTIERTRLTSTPAAAAAAGAATPSEAAARASTINWDFYMQLKFAGNKDHLLKMIQEARLAHLEPSLRRVASSCMMIHRTIVGQDKAPVLSIAEEMLQLCKPQTFSFVALPSVLADDIPLRSLATKIGAVNGPTAPMLVEITKALANHNTTMLPELVSVAAKRGVSYNDVLRRLSMEVGTSILKLSKTDPLSSILNDVQDVAFVVPHTAGLGGVGHPEKGGSLFGLPPLLVAPRKAVGYEYLWCSWLVTPVMPKEISGLCGGRRPTADVVLKNLMHFVNEEFHHLDPAAFSRKHSNLLSCDDVNKAISSAYEVLHSLSREEESLKRLVEAATTASDGTTTAFAVAAARSSSLYFALPLREMPILFPRTCEFVELLKNPTGAVAASPSNESTPQQRHPLFAPPKSVSIAQIVSTEDPKLFGSLHPYFYEQRLFELCPPEYSLLQRIFDAIDQQNISDDATNTKQDEAIRSHSGKTTRFRYPPVEDVLRALADVVKRSAAPQPFSPRTLRNEPLRLYISLLRLLVVSAKFHNVELLWNASSTNCMEGLNTTITSHHQQQQRVVSLGGLWIPNQDGLLVHLVSSGICFPDLPSVTRRIRPDAVLLTHSHIFSSVAKGLKIPSISSVIVEAPQREGETNSVPNAEQKRLQSFLRSTSFLEVLSRLLRTHQHRQPLSSNGAPHYDDYEGSLEDEIGHLLSHQAVKDLKRVEIHFVTHISTKLFHRDAPEVDISSAVHMPHWTLVRANGEPPKILICVNTDVITKTTRTCANRGGGATRGRGRGRGHQVVAQHDQQSQEQQQQHQQQHQQHIPRHYCVAVALCDLLSQHMFSVMMPFCCVLEHVCNTATQQQRAPPPAGDELEEHEDEILLAALHGILDAFDCIGGINRERRSSRQQQQQQTTATSCNRSSGAPSQRHHQDPVTDRLAVATTTPSSTTPPLLSMSTTSTTQPPPASATLPPQPQHATVNTSSTLRVLQTHASHQDAALGELTTIPAPPPYVAGTFSFEGEGPPNAPPQQVAVPQQFAVPQQVEPSSIPWTRYTRTQKRRPLGRY